MATAYAAFTSLMNLITQLHEHQLPPIHLDEKQVDSLSSTIGFFQRFLEVHHNAIDRELEIRIADAAYAAEDLIETQIADRALEQKDFDASLQRSIQGMGNIRNEVTEMKKKEKIQGNDDKPRLPPLASSLSPSASSGERILVGIEEATIKIVDKLTSQQKADRQIISISGMGGIGKTTLAREVYDNLYVRNHFDICAWATVSKDYNSFECLVELLLCIDSTWSKGSLSEKSEQDLSLQLYQSLFGKRYLLILDDMWDIEAWHRIRSFFPASSGSGIVITTRESMFASISSYSFRVDLLDESKSWGLFCKKVFGQDSSCPPELENVGKNIANKCGGLPLSILVIGGHLAKSPRTQEYWEYVANNLSSVVNSEDNERCLKILSLSYNHLPVHLKPCFLHMSMFHEDEELYASRLIKLWVAEGFLKPIDGKSLEEAAEDYLNDLIGRNLVLSSASSLRGKIKFCKLHDLLRDFSLREALEKKFLCMLRKVDDLGALNNERRIVVHPTVDMQHHSEIRNALRSQPLLRTLAFDSMFSSSENKLVRVLIHNADTQSAPTVISGLFNLNMRFLDSNRFPPSISLYWNLQYLFISYHRLNIAPPEIWKMTQLRHITTRSLVLPNPPSESVMKNLRAAKRIINFDFREDVVKRIPNIKNLAVCYNDDYHNFNEAACNLKNINRLQRLESFRCIFELPTVKVFRILPNTLPHSLRKLKFSNLYWDDVTEKIGSLPLLEVLEVHHCFGRKWKLVEGKFVKLKFLKLYSCESLRYFKADKNCFPCLQSLVLQDLDRLKGMSSEIGDIETLKSIQVKSCLDSAVVSAKKIADEQCDLGNEELQVKAILLEPL